ncbi:TolB family protein [Nonomuraea sp. H19]|uniref:TolB family protein n=1 Tax=Nonomuraea sp. H19 TaxID=3452206 RepID=UPI003F8A8ACB
MIAAIALALSLTLSAPATADVTLPGTGGVKYLERAGDPVRLTAYGLGTGRTYLRSAAGGTFAWEKTLTEVSVAPGGRLAAGVPAAYRSGYDTLVVTDRTTGKSTRIRTVKKPLTASYASWSRDGKKVALTVEQKIGGTWRARGFTVVDVAAKTARTVGISGLSSGAGFWWSPDGNLVARHGTGLRLYRPSDGAVMRTLAGVGLPTGPEDAFSPSGRRLATWCPSGPKGQLCLADPITGTIARRMSVRPEAVFGWWDESHLITVMAHQGAYRLAVVDLGGKVTRVLAALPARTWAAELWVSFIRS